MLVGGVAGGLYGAVRPTQDVDLLVDRDPANLDRVGVALTALSARLHVEGLTDEEARVLPVRWDRHTLDRMEIITLTTDAGDLDVLCDIPDREGQRLTYSDLLPGASQLPIGAGLAAFVASPEAIVRSKEWADRPKDHEALPELREIVRRRAQTSEDQPS